MSVFSAKGISRIEQPEKRTYGWYARVRYKGVIRSKFFADAKNGGRGKAFQMAKSWHRKEMRKIIKKIGGKDVEPHTIPKGTVVTVNKSNNTGIVGIQKIVKQKKTTTYKAYRVVYKSKEGYKAKFFSIAKYGEKEAFELARKFKVEKMLEEQ